MVNGTIRPIKDMEEVFKSGWTVVDMKAIGGEIKLM
jgi:hypothetical protein